MGAATVASASARCRASKTPCSARRSGQPGRPDRVHRRRRANRTHQHRGRVRQLPRRGHQGESGGRVRAPRQRTGGGAAAAHGTSCARFFSVTLHLMAAWRPPYSPSTPLIAVSKDRARDTGDLFGTPGVGLGWAGGVCPAFEYRDHLCSGSLGPSCHGRPSRRTGPEEEPSSQPVPVGERGRPHSARWFSESPCQFALLGSRFTRCQPW